jgi:GNAT superfamily N-acetyltransferase
MNHTSLPTVTSSVSRRPTVTAVLADGSQVQLRPVTPDDKPLLADGFNRLSPRARYLRFLAPADRLSASQLAYLSEVDHRHHVAWGVLDVAVTVLDAYQRRGIGRLLLEVLAVTARARGIGTFHFDVLAENEAMLALLASLGSVPTDEAEVAHHVLDVSRVAAPRIVEGDLIGLLEDARRTSSSISPDPTPD